MAASMAGRRGQAGGRLRDKRTLPPRASGRKGGGGPRQQRRREEAATATAAEARSVLMTGIMAGAEGRDGRECRPCWSGSGGKTTRSEWGRAGVGRDGGGGEWVPSTERGRREIGVGDGEAVGSPRGRPQRLGRAGSLPRLATKIFYQGAHSSGPTALASVMSARDRRPIPAYPSRAEPRLIPRECDARHGEERKKAKCWGGYIYRSAKV